MIGRKCRAEFADVIALEAFRPGARTDSGASSHDNGKTTYTIGATVRPDKYDPDPRVECSHGIHFFLTREEAEEYGRGL